MSPKIKSTDLLHGDASVNRERIPVAPSISVSTTFRADPKMLSLEDVNMRNPSRHVYSRYTQETSTSVEHILGKVLDGYAVTYASGLAACFAVNKSSFDQLDHGKLIWLQALVFYKPKRIAIRGGYWGCHNTIEVYKKCRDANVEVIDFDEKFQPGDLCWVETPVNPTGESRDIQYYADKIHQVGGKLVVDSTFAPPPLQYPFKLGADCILHSATKYLGGHSDLLAGVLVVKTEAEWFELHSDRTFLGSMMGSLESWLLLRSMRTFDLRVLKQSATATKLVQWLNNVASATATGSSFDGVPAGVLKKVCHSSLQGTDSRGFNPSQQMEGGWNATFSILLSTPEYAKELPYLAKYFIHATSLGGVDSLMEYRARADPKEDPTLVRISVGLEDFEDLRDDMRQALIRCKTEKTKL
ncbi:Cys/Met metabolism PLP-dependent enzyme-domain-containing protein [Rhodocollybia butyracea]|uniref:Cys/Met metabolism PLP-dependent enzyme-domain-containing protein n=1 Tax=Rhodocollybia butyracea TaxID=206335 RepID=A0A9P5Q910_9AGAR|nr:Cys/Met metabolism PLP-dependent enzyme-domain-containing protein [Rhodocollybia butyracea]